MASVPQDLPCLLLPQSLPNVDPLVCKMPRMTPRTQMGLLLPLSRPRRPRCNKSAPRAFLHFPGGVEPGMSSGHDGERLAFAVRDKLQQSGAQNGLCAGWGGAARGKQLFQEVSDLLTRSTTSLEKPPQPKVLSRMESKDFLSMPNGAALRGQRRFREVSGELGEVSKALASSASTRAKREACDSERERLWAQHEQMSYSGLPRTRKATLAFRKNPSCPEIGLASLNNVPDEPVPDEPVQDSEPFCRARQDFLSLTPVPAG